MRRFSAKIVQLFGGYKNKRYYYSHSALLLLKILVSALCDSGEGGYGDSLMGIRILNSDSLVFVGEIAHNAGGKYVEGATEEDRIRWGINDMDLEV